MRTTGIFAKGRQGKWKHPTSQRGKGVLSFISYAHKIVKVVCSKKFLSNPFYLVPLFRPICSHAADEPQMTDMLISITSCLAEGSTLLLSSSCILTNVYYLSCHVSHDLPDFHYMLLVLWLNPISPWLYPSSPISMLDFLPVSKVLCHKPKQFFYYPMIIQCTERYPTSLALFLSN